MLDRRLVTSSTADRILFNANVLTFESTKPQATLVAIKAGRIICVGDHHDLSRYRGPETKMVDCERLTLVPGLNDAHVHVLALAASLVSVDCSPLAAVSIGDIQRLLRAKAVKLPKGTWVKGMGYNEFYFNEKRHPNRWDLDRVVPNHPVKLDHRSKHACVLNSMALTMAGITSETPDPPGGLIERDTETGEPTGLIYGANGLLGGKMAPPLSRDEFDEGMRLTNQLLLSSGITSIQDATAHNTLEHWRVFERLKAEDKIAARITMMIGDEALPDLRSAGMGSGYGDDMLRLGALKITIDQTRGPLNPSQRDLNEKVLAHHRAGLQVAIHAVEEGTVEAAIIALEDALKRLPKANHRHRIEHCSECPPRLLSRLQKMKALVVTQPAFLYYSGERYLSTVERKQIPHLYPVRSFWDAGLKPASSSDAPIVSINPMMGIHAAVNRRAENGDALSPDQAISPLQALAMYTTSAAYASFQERAKGTITEGKVADMVLLSADPTKVYPEEIKGIQVEKTIIAGHLAWDRNLV